MPRPTDLSREVHARIVDLLRAGNYRETAAKSAGVSASTLRQWMQRGARGEEPFASFADDVSKAEGASEARSVALVAQAEKTNWHAAAWRLERRHPERFAPQVAIHLQLREQIDAFLDTLQRRLPKEVYDLVLNAVADSRGEGESDGEEGSASEETRTAD